MNVANNAIATPLNGVIPHPRTTLQYFEFNGFNKFPMVAHFGPDLELPSMFFCNLWT